MTPDKAAIRAYFAKLDLPIEIADIYLSLHVAGPQTISELSRSSGIERTRIYRLIPELMESSLIEVESHYKRGVLKAAPIANLNILISKRAQELESLQDELQLVEQVLARNSLSSPASRVQFYYGAEGAKQMLWNETRAKSEVVGILYETIQRNTKGRFFARWAAQCNKAGVHFRGVYGDNFQSTPSQESSTENSEHLTHWQGRYIDPKVFPITHSMFIYDDVVAYYNWKDNEIFGVEIYNQDIAASQRQMFELLWLQAKESAPATQ